MADIPIKGSEPSPVNVTVFGKTIPILFGSAQVLGAPFWAGQVITNPDGSREVTYAAILGVRDPLTSDVQLLKVWIDGNLAYTNDGTITSTNAFQFTFYDGSEGQLPDPTIQAQQGADNTPAFRDRMYIVIRGWHVGIGAKFPEVTCEITQTNNADPRRFVTPFATAGAPMLVLDDSNAVNGGRQFVDIGLGYQWCLDTANQVRVFDINQEAELFKVPLAVGFLATGRYTPYIFGQRDQSVYGRLAVQDLQGNVAQVSDTRSLDGIEHLFATHPLYDGTQYVFGSAFGPRIVSALFNPTAFTIELVRVDDTPGPNAVGQVVPVTVPVHLVSPDNDYGFAYLGFERHIAVAINLKKPKVVIAKRITHYTQADITQKIPLHDVEDKLELNHDVVQSVIDLTPFFRDTLSEPHWDSITVSVMCMDPVGGKWLTALYTSTQGPYIYWVKFNTPFNDLGTINGGHHVGNAAGDVFPSNPPPLPNVTDFERVAYRKLEGISSINYGPLIDAFASIPDNETEICFTIAGGETVPNGLCVLDMATGEYKIYQHGIFENENTGEAYSNYAFDQWSIWNKQRKGLFYRNGRGMPEPGFVRLQQKAKNGNTLALSDYMRSLALLAGFPTEQIETDELTDAVVGGVINTATSFLDLVTVVCDVFRIDIVESEGKIKFRHRVRDNSFMVDRTLTLDNLATLDQSNDDDGTVIQKDRDGTVMLPSVLSLAYLDSDNDFQIGTQTAKRTFYPVRTSAGTLAEATGVPLAMSAATALYWAEFCLFDRWAEALKLTIRLPQSHLDLEPGDYIRIETEHFGSYTTKITEIDLNSDFSLLVMLSSILTLSPSNSNINPINVASIDEGRLDSLDQSGIFQFFAIDNFSPYSADGGEDEADLYVYADTKLATYLAKTDGTYVKSLAITPTPNGVLLNALPAVPLWAISRPDYDSVINVRMYTGEPVIPLDDDAWRAGGSAVAVGTPGRWELIYFRARRYNSGDGTWTLSGLIRGQRGTDTVNARRPGDAVVVITQGSPGVLGYTAHNGRLARVAASYPDQSPTAPNSKAVSVTLLGGSVRPWAPVQVQATRSGGDIVLTWSRRDRKDNLMAFADGAEVVPLSETVESYDVDIIADDGTVKRTYANLPGPTGTYTSADIGVDGLDVTSTVHVVVYQNSSLVGRGYGRDIVCPVN